jgi:hypothetical protein
LLQISSKCLYLHHHTYSSVLHPRLHNNTPKTMIHAGHLFSYRRQIDEE